MSLLQENISRIKNLMNLTESESLFTSEEKNHLSNFVDLVVKELGIKNEVNIDYTEDKSKVDTTAV